MPLQHSRFHNSPGRTLLASIIAIIIIGTLLLALPQAQLKAHTFIDLLFTATSAVCVTGLMTTPLESFTLLGKIIILGLIQIGGIGLITMTVFLMSIFFKIGIKTHLFAGQLLELDNWKNSRRIITFIITVTFLAECIGALLIFFTLSTTNNIRYTIFTALFHSISAFCSAGFSIFPHGIESLNHNTPFLMITGLLIFVGELGFITLHELFIYVRSWFTKKKSRISLHSKIVLSSTFFLLMISTLLLFIIEYNNTLQASTLLNKVSNTLFNAMSLRSCGFITTPLTLMLYPTVFLIMIITFIGSSPNSTGSGIKITSFALLLATIRSVITGRTVIELRGRRIPHDQIFKVFAVFTLALLCIGITTFTLLITEQNHSFVAILFESCAAFANLGISLDVTHTLSFIGKIVIIVNMIIGRIGALTMILAIKKHKETTEFQYPEERIMLS